MGNKNQSRRPELQLQLQLRRGCSCSCKVGGAPPGVASHPQGRTTNPPTPITWGCVAPSRASVGGWVGGAPMGVRRTLKGAPPTQAAAAAAVAVAAAAFLKKNKKIGNAQRAKGAKKKQSRRLGCSCSCKVGGAPLGVRRTLRGAPPTYSRTSSISSITYNFPCPCYRLFHNESNFPLR